MKIQMIIIGHKENTFTVQVFVTNLTFFSPDVPSSLLYFFFSFSLSLFFFFLETYFLPHLPVNDEGRGVTAR